ncbi:hypothetical protein ACJIZ3_023615 [Penstemon smallii]|uniref:Uncharacterized protein n=1 Tax=Penstemon smallii TaxID=265156 RepID=A0ABD3TPJ8_9LAMI
MICRGSNVRHWGFVLLLLSVKLLVEQSHFGGQPIDLSDRLFLYFLSFWSPILSVIRATIDLVHQQLSSVVPLVEDLKLKKEERLKQFADIKTQVEKINGEISGYGNQNVAPISYLNLEEQDLSLRKLTEYQSNLLMDHVNKIHTLSSVLCLDFGKIVNDVHPSLHESSPKQVTNISDSTLDGLDQAITRLKTERKIRFQKLNDVAGSLFELWKLMDTRKEEKVNFLRITSILGLQESEIVQPSSLSLEIIFLTEIQEPNIVERLTKLKANRMKELVMMKKSELDDICCKTHIQPDLSTAPDKTNAMIDSGLVDPCELLANIESQIYKAKDEALSRGEIMDRIDKWLSACNEKNWLEDYIKGENRYCAGRGVHINLKRAERARITILDGRALAISFAFLAVYIFVNEVIFDFQLWLIV